MSDTPRTDAFQNERHTMNAYRKVLAFARQLERELNEAKREIELIEKAWRNERECTKTWKAMAQELAVALERHHGAYQEGEHDICIYCNLISRFNALNKP